MDAIRIFVLTLTPVAIMAAISWVLLPGALEGNFANILIVLVCLFFIVDYSKWVIRKHRRSWHLYISLKEKGINPVAITKNYEFHKTANAYQNGKIEFETVLKVAERINNTGQYNLAKTLAA